MTNNGKALAWFAVALALVLFVLGVRGCEGKSFAPGTGPSSTPTLAPTMIYSGTGTPEPGCVGPNDYGCWETRDEQGPPYFWRATPYGVGRPTS